MLSFMFGVLFSVTFWAIYIPVSFVIAVGFIKSIFPDQLDPITKGTGGLVNCIIQLILVMLLWPILIVLVAGYYLFKSLMTKFVTNLLKITINKIPSIKVTFDDNKKESKDKEKSEE